MEHSANVLTVTWLSSRTEVRVIVPSTAAPIEATQSQTNIKALQTQEANAHPITQ